MKRKGSSVASGLVTALFTVALTLAWAAPTTAQTFTTLASFDNTDGGAPQYMSLIQGVNGNLYGTAVGGGAHDGGVVFEVTPGGTLTTLYSFCAKTSCADGYLPYGGLILATNGNFYGTTELGGANSSGTVFSMTSGGTLTTLYNFCAKTGCTDGGDPAGRLTQGTDGNLYGTTGSTPGNANYGTVFKITLSGTLTTLHSFCAQTGCPDGSDPFGGLVQGTDGNFYGTTAGGGAHGDGTVFKITSTGVLTTVYSFCALAGCDDGTDPTEALIQGTDGNFYSTTHAGGAKNGGTVFKVTSGGTLTTLYSFCSQPSCADGEAPYAGLFQATDGNLYGTTWQGGRDWGTAFKVTTGGAFSVLHSFCTTGNYDTCTDGINPQGGLFQATNGILYGTTYNGGSPPTSDGSVFSINMGLGDFVETVPTSGAVATAVKILGTDLTGATSVTFNGKAATFTVASSTEITTKVPTGATTGTVRVVTPGGTLSSNVTFRVP
jgi:uncharacterized repeat protein (TIGR03803 family)